MLVKFPVAKSPPVHVYAGAVLDPAAIAAPVGSASAAAMARDPRILRRMAFSMSTRHRPLLGAVAPGSDGVGLAIGPAWRSWRPDRDAALVNPPPEESSHPVVGGVCIAVTACVQ